MSRERLLMRFEGTILNIQSVRKKRSVSKQDFHARDGLVEILYSRSSNYTRVFAVFKETSWPSHHFKTTTGLLVQDDNNIIHLTTKHHIYTFKIKKIHINNIK